jgi:hypothetical protein
MNDARRLDVFLRFTRISLLFTVASLFTATGCGRSNTPPLQTDAASTEDAMSVALGRLEKDSDAATCNEVLTTLDSGIAGEKRPKPDSERLQTLANLLRPKPVEFDYLAQKEFASRDADYLESCLLIRDAMRSLELGDFAPAKQAELAFAWICRQVYIRGRPIYPSPPWWSLEAGSGSGIDRTYIFLEALRQLNLDGCIVGPPELVDMPSDDAPKGVHRYAKVAAVGVRILGDVLLFDPWLGKPVSAGHGKGVAKFSDVKSDPTQFNDWLASRGIRDDPKKWELFLAVPFESLSPRMEWLEQQMKAKNPVNLYVDGAGMLARFETTERSKDTRVRFWNPPSDLLSLGRVIAFFHQEMRSDTGRMFSAAKQEFRSSHFPTEFIPRLSINNQPLQGRPFELVQGVFRAQFANVLIVHGSPRDNLIRGNLENASHGARDLKERNDAISERIRMNKGQVAKIGEWAQQANTVFAAVRRAEQAGDEFALMQAKKAEEEFLRSDVSEAVDSLIFRNTSRLLSAEAAYLQALLVHEKAERAQARLENSPAKSNETETLRMWQNAEGHWKRYLESYLDLRPSFNDRDRHAQELLDRCESMRKRADKSKEPVKS